MLKKANKINYLTKIDNTVFILECNLKNFSTKQIRVANTI